MLVLPSNPVAEVEYAVSVDEVADKVVAGEVVTTAVVASGATSCATACVG